MNYKTDLIKAKSELNGLPELPKKATAQDKCDRKDKIKELAARIKLLESLCVWELIDVGCEIQRDDRVGIVTQKIINPGGMPQLWVCWDGSDLPYPEVGLTQIKVLRQQQRAA